MSVLNRATLASVAEQHRLDGVSVELPRYPRHCDKRICHIGVGGFHRAHQAWYLHRLLQDGLADGWGIVGIGLRAQDRVLSGILRHQDRSEEHTSELQSLMCISYAVCCLKKKNK